MKVFIGPRLRRLRKEAHQTQGDMGRALGISTSYVNLLEKNERSVSVPVLLKLLEVYGVDWRDIAEDEDTAQLADLRAALQDPLFDGDRPDLAQLRAALSHSPDLSGAFLRLHRAYLAATDQLMSVTETRDPEAGRPSVSPEAAVHTFFRRRKNYFHELELPAEEFWGREIVAPDDVYAAIKARLRDRLGIQVRVVAVQDMPGTLRTYDEERREVMLSQALDHPNRVFQLAHVCGLIEQKDTLNRLLAEAGVKDARGQSRCRTATCRTPRPVETPTRPPTDLLAL